MFCAATGYYYCCFCYLTWLTEMFGISTTPTFLRFLWKSTLIFKDAPGWLSICRVYFVALAALDYELSYMI